LRFSHTVYDDIEEDREGKRRRCFDVQRERKNGDRAADKDDSECSALAREILARGIGRPAVRAITASMAASYDISRAPAAPAPAAMPTMAMNPRNAT
jgi:hypothetical protein